MADVSQSQSVWALQELPLVYSHLETSGEHEGTERFGLEELTGAPRCCFTGPGLASRGSCGGMLTGQPGHAGPLRAP